MHALFGAWTLVRLHCNGARSLRANGPRLSLSPSPSPGGTPTGRVNRAQAGSHSLRIRGATPGAYSAHPGEQELEKLGKGRTGGSPNPGGLPPTDRLPPHASVLDARPPRRSPG